MLPLSLKRWLRSERCRHPLVRSRADERRVRPALEALEDRVVPVVGATAVPAAAPTGAGYDGVARMTAANGTFHNASLLFSGMHLVTTAAAVTNTSTTILAGDYTLDFDLPSGRISVVVRYNASLNTIELHPSWNGSTASGNDVAVIALPDQDNLNTANRFMIA